MFDAEKVTNEIVEFVRNYFKTNNIKGCVIGISGGKDSAVCAGLMVRAIGKDNVIGVTMPCHSNNSDMEDAVIIMDLNLLMHHLLMYLMSLRKAFLLIIVIVMLRIVILI